jgi:mono/diheme cytochrome c family protein
MLPFAVLAWAVAGGPASGETTGATTSSAAAPAADTFAQLAPILQRSCGACHGAEKAESELRLDRLDPDLVNGADHGRWREVFDRLSIGDMPPEDATPLPEADRERLKQWLVRELKRGELARNPPAHFRRLTRLEYERTMQDLLGLPLEFGKRLPEDGRAKSGFRNDGDMLRMSPEQVELYLQIAEEALDRVIVEGPPPMAHRYRFTPVCVTPDGLAVTVLPRPDDRPCETFGFFPQPDQKDKGPVFRKSNASSPSVRMLPPAAIERKLEAGVFLPEHRFAVRLAHRFPHGEALIRVRVAKVPEAEGGGTSGRPAWLSVAIGTTNFHGVEIKPLGQPLVIDHDDFRIYEFRVRMEDAPLPNTTGRSNETVIVAWNSARMVENDARPPLLRIDWVEFENPFLEQWPPATHRAIVADDGGTDEAARARRVIERFATRAFRRPLDPVELDLLCGLWKTARGDAVSFEASVRETLAVVLTSPEFLALPAARGSSLAGGPEGTAGSAGVERVDAFQLAARLSYFLWSTMPDEPLMALARSGQLRAPEALAEQTRRMLTDPWSWDFFHQFTEQWLELDKLQRVVLVFDRKQLAFRDDLIPAMRQETVHFVAGLVRENRSLFELVDSPDTFVNEMLAAHYGIEGVHGPEFRRVALAPEHHRGGLLTQAAILAGNSDGVEGHPIKRGMWLVKNLLDEPPPPPPPNVPEIERKDPKNRGLNLRQMLAQHRESKACAGCHRQIDPWGLAFEEYDAQGRWRPPPPPKNPADALVELPNGAKINGLRELKAELVRSKADVIRRAVARKFLAYALGRTLSIADVEAADALAARLRDRGDGLGDLVAMIVQSEAFQAR